MIIKTGQIKVTEDKQDSKIQVPKVVSMVANAYGPYAFGVVSLLIVWFSIVKPELNARQLDFASQMEIVESQRGNIEALKSVTSTMESTAESLKITATIMDKTADKINDLR